jgi:hypothetical protein
MRFDSIAERLLKGGVLPRHVRRYIGELEDHFAELTTQLERGGLDKKDAELQARARLGDETELVSAMLDLPNIRAWSARAPWLVFAALPPIMAFIIFFVSVGMVRLMSPLGGLAGSTLVWLPVSYEPFARWFVDVSNLVIAPAVSAAFAIMVVRQRLNGRWALLAALSIAMLGLQDSTYFSEQTTVGNLGQTAALWFDDGRELMKTWRLSTLQAVLTLLPAAILPLYRRRLSS